MNNMMALPGMGQGYHKRQANLSEPALTIVGGRGAKNSLLATSSHSTSLFMGVYGESDKRQARK